MSIAGWLVVLAPFRLARPSNARRQRKHHDARQTNELNLKIANLNDVARKLTAITVILMLPTLIASHSA
jgi:Mg2+ and Co2+ transporter CorA